MVTYYGDFPVNHTSVVIPFNAFTSNDPAASATITDFANTDVHIHKNGSLTQRASSAGVAIDIDVDAITGGHWVTIDLSDNTDAGFYAAGSEISVRIEGVTIDGATVNAFIGAFSIERTGGILALLKHADYGLAQLIRSTTPANKLTVDANGEVTVPDTQKVDVETVKTQAVTCAAGVTMLASVGTAATSTAQTGDVFPLVSTEVAEIYAAVITNAAGTDIAADIIAVKADVAGLAGAAMRGTDSAALASVCTEGRLSELDAITAGKMAYVADVIAVDVAGLDGAAMRGTDSAALASVCTEGRLAELDAANLPTDVANVVKTTTTIADEDSLAANSLLLWIRRMRWMLNNRMAVVDATGAYTLYKDDGTTTAATGTVTDDSTTTTRSVPTWA